MALNMYEQFVLDEIEGGLHRDKFPKRFRRIERSHMYIERPILFAALVWGVAAVVTMLLTALLSVLLGVGLALMVVTALLVFAPVVALSLYLTKR
jgi:hypothetical protein